MGKWNIGEKRNGFSKSVRISTCGNVISATGELLLLLLWPSEVIWSWQTELPFQEALKAGRRTEKKGRRKGETQDIETVVLLYLWRVEHYFVTGWRIKKSRNYFFFWYEKERNMACRFCNDLFTGTVADHTRRYKWW